MTELEDQAPGQLDPHKSTFVMLVGMKGSGKSIVASRLYRSWPLDKACIDPTGDADPGPEATPIVELPARMPRREDGKHVNLHYIADSMSPTFVDDLNRSLAMGLWPKDRPALVWLDEYGQVDTIAGQPSPHLRTALNQGRHHGLSLLMCCPRPMTITPLALQQADRIYLFDVPSDNDLKRISEYAGFPHDRLAEAMRDVLENCPPFTHLVLEKRKKPLDGSTRQPRRLHRMPPLPLDE